MKTHVWILYKSCISHLRLQLKDLLINLSLIHCTEINSLILSCLDKLAKVNVEDSTHINNIVIEAQSLRIFKYNRCYDPYEEVVCNLNVSRCKNLEVLHLDSSAHIKGLNPDFFPISFPLRVISPHWWFITI